jgi:hypothetical protein
MILISFPIEKFILACWFGPPPSHQTSCTPTKSILYFDNSSVTVLSEPALYMLLTFHVANLMSIFLCLGPLSKESVCSRLLVNFRNKIIFYGEELLAPRPTPKLEDHPLSAVCDCLFKIFAATLHIWRPFLPSATWGRAMPWWQGSHLTYYVTNFSKHFSLFCFPFYLYYLHVLYSSHLQVLCLPEFCIHFQTWESKKNYHLTVSYLENTMLVDLLYVRGR